MDKNTEFGFILKVENKDSNAQLCELQLATWLEVARQLEQPIKASIEIIEAVDSPISLKVDFKDYTKEKVVAKEIEELLNEFVRYLQKYGYAFYEESNFNYHK